MYLDWHTVFLLNGEVCNECNIGIHDSKKLKTHLILVDSIIDFGPTQCYNTERYEMTLRYEAFNSLIRTLRMYLANIAKNLTLMFFSTSDSPALVDTSMKLDDIGYSRIIIFRCGQGLQTLYSSPQVQRMEFLLKVCLICIIFLKVTAIYKLPTVSCYETPFRDLMHTCTLHNLPEGVSLQSNVLTHQVVITIMRQMLVVLLSPSVKG